MNKSGGYISKKSIWGQIEPNRLDEVGSKTARLRFTVAEVGEPAMKEAVVREKKFQLQNCVSKELKKQEKEIKSSYNLESGRLRK